MTVVQRWRQVRNAKTSVTWPAAWTQLERAGDALALALETAEARLEAAGFPHATRYESWPMDVETQMSRRTEYQAQGESTDSGQKMPLVHQSETDHP
jgi:hypothetical protein